MKKIVMILLPMVVMLTSCASHNDVEINRSYDTMATQFHQEQTVQVATKTDAIKQTMAYDCEDGTEACGVAKAFSKMLAAQYIAGVEAQTFTMARAKTGVDVQDKGVGFTRDFIAGITTLGTVKFITDNQPSTTYNNDGNVENAGNYVEAHTTTAGDGNSGLTSAAEKDRPTSEFTDEEDEVNDGGVPIGSGGGTYIVDPEAPSIPLE